MSRIPGTDLYYQSNTGMAPVLDAYGNPINAPIQNIHTTSTTTHYTSGYDVPTGSEKFVYKENPQGYVAKEKSSYNNPITGISEKVKSKSKGKADKSNTMMGNLRDRSRSRSNSSERRRRLNNNMNTPVMTQVPQVNTYNASSSYVPPMSAYNSSSTTTYSNQPMNYNQPMGYNQPMSYNQPVSSNIGMAPSSITTPLSYNEPLINRPLNLHNPTQLYAEEKGKIKNTATGTKTSEKLTFVDPVTGFEENAKIKTKVKGDRSRSRSQGKSKTAYQHKVEDTLNGPKV
jgi:hypothetical protein